MIKKLKDIKIYGLIFTILSILFVMAFGTPFSSKKDCSRIFII